MGRCVVVASVLALAAGAVYPLSSAALSKPSISIPTISTPTISTPTISTPTISIPTVPLPPPPKPPPPPKLPPPPSPARQAPAGPGSAGEGATGRPDGAGPDPVGPEASRSIHPGSSADGPDTLLARAISASAGAIDALRRRSVDAVRHAELGDRAGTERSIEFGRAGLFANRVGRIGGDRAGGAGKHRATRIPGGSALTTPQLRRLVRALNGCLSALSPRQAKLLTLRAGIGRRQSLTPHQVARVLHVGAQRESRIEQQAVAALNRASARGRCVSPAMSIQNAVGRMLTALAPPALIAPPVASTGGRRPGTTSRNRNGSVPRSTTGGQSSTARIRSASVGPSGQGGPDLLLLALAIAAGVAALWLIAARLRAAEPEHGARPASPAGLATWAGRQGCGGRRRPGRPPRSTAG